MYKVQPPRLVYSRPRQKTVLFLALALITLYLLVSRTSRGYHVVPFSFGGSSATQKLSDEELARKKKEKHEQDLRDEFKAEYEAAKSLPGADAIYGNTLASLVAKEDRKQEFADQLKEGPKKNFGFTIDRPFIFNPYPDYESKEWKDTHRGAYVPCQGALGDLVEDDILVYKGHPHSFPAPGMGSYDVLNLDGNLCFERETRLGPYGLTFQVTTDGYSVVWENVNWGELQRECLDKNKARFDMTGKPNPYLHTAYATSKYVFKDPLAMPVSEEESLEELRKEKKTYRRRGLALASRLANSSGAFENKSSIVREPRTAILLRSYTGKTYSENDKEVIRSLITELSLRTGGQFQVYLLVHVRDTDLAIWDDEETYEYVLNGNVPREFHSITELWNDESVWKIYTALTDDDERSVHTAQWLSVQKFSQEHPEYDFIWNWEMDARFTGHHYDFLSKLDTFAKKQPRRGLWERNERYYIPSLHGDYDTDFRRHVEARSGADTIWYPPSLPFINPVGPKPPVRRPVEDNYQWGVGEDADLITLGPIFNPINSSWVIANQVWGYSDKTHHKEDLPRRTTIVTQSRISKRLLDIMHIENLRGNHIASEMTPQTVALLHGFKAVFAPHPMFFDRPWNGTFLNKWFNPGPRGTAGGEGSSMGWGRERRYQGSTWYYRTEPPTRMYNNWMGYEDWDIGGEEWEQEHGRPCLPPIMLHPIKEVQETKKGFKSEYQLGFG